jgi:hypothetical protein
MPVTMAGRPEDVKSGAAQWALALACALLWLAKFWLVPRLNINWDEFHFLSNVHAAARGELTQGLQNAYTHLFAWLPRINGDEITQIRIARVVMVLLLGTSALLIQRLASRWFGPAAAWTAALAFLSMLPTLKHGGSFRADSLLLPLQLGALVALTSPRFNDRNRGLVAGLLLGCATVVSIKAILLAPVVAVLGVGDHGEWRRGMRRLAWLAGAATTTAAILLGAHLLSIHGDASGASGAEASGAWQKTIQDAPWLPQMGTLRALVQEDLAIWVVAGAGLTWALWRRMWSVAACTLALLPILFYRNSFAYFYVVMWGPACLVIAAACAGLQHQASRIARPGFVTAATLTLAAVICAQGLLRLPLLSYPRQTEQRQLVAAVHAIFPAPVAYIDHSGMIASFRKVNFFMTSWGVESYLARGRPFMPRTVERNHPPMLISNRPVLMPGTPPFGLLLPEDRAVIENQYQPYWGPIRIAGGATTFTAPGSTTLQLPFGGRYRLESSGTVLLDGQALDPGAVIDVGDARLSVQVDADSSATAGWPLTVRLLWADAGPPPDGPVTSIDYYDSL